MAQIKMRKTHVAKPKELRPLWHVFDARSKPLGRLASEIARILQGKHRPIYTPTINTGDYVVVVNSSRVNVTGKKREQKEYNFHSQYPGGHRTFTMEQLQRRNPSRIVELAVRGMLPKTTLGRQMLKRLKIYPGSEHPHQAQIRGAGSNPGIQEQGGEAS